LNGLDLTLTKQKEYRKRKQGGEDITMPTREDRLARSKDVKERIGPIVHRLKASLETIQKLEDSAAAKTTNASSCSNKVGGTKSTDDSDDSNDAISPSHQFVPGRSRKLMQSSMEMVKRKLLKLKSLEEMLVESDDRREFLEHQMVQITTDRHNILNSILQGRVEELEHDKVALEEKCEALTATCDELVDSLRKQEDRVAFLEEELLETRKYGVIPIVRSSSSISGGPPRTIHSHTSQEGSSSPFSFGEGSSGRSMGSSRDDNELSSLPSTSDFEVSGMHQSLHWTPTVSVSLLEPTSQRSDDGDDHDEASSPEAVMIQRLMEKIEALDRENAELRESKQRAAGKFQAQCEEMKRHTSLIEDMRRKLDSKQKKDGKRMGTERKNIDRSCETTCSTGDKEAGNQGVAFFRRIRGVEFE
jgi:hypothetical protein